MSDSLDSSLDLSGSHTRPIRIDDKKGGGVRFDEEGGESVVKQCSVVGEGRWSILAQHEVNGVGMRKTGG